MKLIIILNDSEGRQLEYQHTNVLNAPSRRSVQIELTPKQVEKIGIREIGVDRGRVIKESIESVSLCSE